LEQWSNLPHALAPARMNKRRKNETSTYVPSHGYSHAPCLRLPVAKNIPFSRNAAALEITKSRLKESVNDNAKEKTKT
jgi:hypothetical protein